MRFQDKVVVVTGAAVGIGQAALVAFAREGARVALVDRDRERGLALLDELRRAGYEALAVGAAAVSYTHLTLPTSHDE